MNTTPLLLVLAGLGLVTCGFVDAAQSSSLTGTRLTVEYRAWTMTTGQGGETTLSQIHIPVAGTAALGSQTAVVVEQALAPSSFEVSRNSEKSLTGVSNLDLAIHHRIPSRGLLLMAGASVPSGTTGLAAPQLELARLLAHPLLGMPAREFGHGLDLRAAFAWSRSLSEGLTVGAGIGATLPGSYALAQAGPDYSPSPQGSISGGVRLFNGKSTGPQPALTATAQMSYRTYLKDQVGGRTVYEEGGELEILVRGESRWERWRVDASAGILAKAQDAVYSEAGEAASAVKQASGTGSVGRVKAGYLLRSGFLVGLTAAWRGFTGSDDLSRNGHSVGVGPDLDFRFAGRSWFRVQGQYLFGTAGDGTSRTDLSGMALTLGLIWRPGS